MSAPFYPVDDFIVANVKGAELAETDWRLFEEKVTPQEKQVGQMLKEVGLAGTSSKSVFSWCMTTFGLLYWSLRGDSKVCSRIGMEERRSNLDDIKQAKPKGKGAKKGQQKGASVEEIRFANTMKKYEAKRSEFLSSWKRTHWDVIPSASQNSSVEMLVLDMLQHINGFCKNIAKVEITKVYDLIFGCSKFIESLRTLEVRNMESLSMEFVNPLLIQDLVNKLEELKQVSRFSIVTAAKEFPKYLVKTSYDGILPGMTCVPYESQTEMINALTVNKENGLLACLNTMTGEGKTTLVAAISALVQSWNTFSSVQYEVIYCCSQKLQTIAKQVGMIAWNLQIPFGVAVMKYYADKPAAVKVRNNYNCEKLRMSRVLLIADIASTIKLLEKKDEKKQYILFFDEPTVDLDFKNSPMIEFLTGIFSVMPKFTILSTATAPERESIPLLEQIFLSKYPGAAVKFIKSSIVRIASEISDLDGNIFIPHANCTTVEQFKYVIRKIKSDCFLQKCYAPNVVNEMFVKLSELSMRNGMTVPTHLNFEWYLNQTANMNQDAICKLAILYLQTIADASTGVSEPDAFVTEFCSFRFTKRGINFATLATEAHQFESQTLIVTKRPEEFLEAHFSDYLKSAMHDITKHSGYEETTSFDDVYEVYYSAKQRFDAEKEEIENDKSKAKSKSYGIDGAEHEAQRKLRLDALQEPTIPVPSRMVIGSSTYMCERGATTTLKNFVVESIHWNHIQCNDSQKLALCLGIGLYSRSYHPSYTNLVLQLASKGQLAYLIADDAICYGTNYPIENVIVDDSCLTPEAHSVKTIFQVFARAGRPGKSWRANVFASPVVLEMISDFIHNPIFSDIEVSSMNKALVASVIGPIIAKKSERCMEALEADRKAREAEKHAIWQAREAAEIKARQTVIAATTAAKATEVAKTAKYVPKTWVPRNMRK